MTIREEKYLIYYIIIIHWSCLIYQFNNYYSFTVHIHRAYTLLRMSVITIIDYLKAIILHNIYLCLDIYIVVWIYFIYTHTHTYMYIRICIYMIYYLICQFLQFIKLLLKYSRRDVVNINCWGNLKRFWNSTWVLY